MAKIRVYELAKKLNMTNKVLLSKLKVMNIDVKSHMSSLEDKTVTQIKKNLFGKKRAKADIRVKPSVIRRPKQRESEPPADAPVPVDEGRSIHEKSPASAKDSKVKDSKVKDSTTAMEKTALATSVPSEGKTEKMEETPPQGTETQDLSVHCKNKAEVKPKADKKDTREPDKPAKIVKLPKTEPSQKTGLSKGKKIEENKKEESVSSVLVEQKVQTQEKREKRVDENKAEHSDVKSEKKSQKKLEKKSEKKVSDTIKTDAVDHETDPVSEVKKKKHKKKKNQKKSTPARIIKMAVPLPVTALKEQGKPGEKNRKPKHKVVRKRPVKSSERPSHKPVQHKPAAKQPAIPLAGSPSEVKAQRKKYKKKKGHGVTNSEEFIVKTKKLKKRKSIVEGKDLYENKRGGKRGRKKDSRTRKDKIQSTTITKPKAIKRRIKIDETIELSDFAKRMGIKANEMIAKLMTLGFMVTLNQTIDFDTAAIVASEFEFEVEKASFEEDIFIHAHDTENDAGVQITRPPVVTIMGHVDHGKTSLLDVIRKSKITTGEAGGITQHIGAYSVKTDNGAITFLDTPGHAAFTAMRARGTQFTDIVVLVVAADDGVMPQTIEAINHSRDAGVPVVVAINKMDKPDADPDRVMRELSDHGFVPEEWGGEVIFVKVSAKAETGIDALLEMILLQSEVLELKANPDRLAKGHVVEARLDAGRGPIATILVEQGTLKAGQPVVCGLYAGKIRMMVDDTGANIKTAGPSTPVEIIGLSGVPEAGDEFVALDSEKDAKQISLHRMQKQRSKELAKKSRANLEKLFASMGTDKAKELNLIIKADVNGSIEALTDSLMKLEKDEVNIKIVHSGTGTINESDVSLAVVSHAIIVGFNVRPGSQVREMAKKENVDMRFYDIIYNVINDIKAAINGLMPSIFNEIIIGRAEVRDTFVIPNKGTIAGSFILEGKVVRGEKIRLLRDGVVKCDTILSSLRRFKDDVKEVLQGYECGISIEKYNDIKIGDVFECYRIEERRPEMEPIKE